MLDTNKHTKWRKVLAINAAKRIQAISDNKTLTQETKITAFRTYIKPNFMYSCEIWKMKSNQAENIIHAFQERLLRTYVLNVKWVNTILPEVHRRTRVIE